MHLIALVISNPFLFIFFRFFMAISIAILIRQEHRPRLFFLFFILGLASDGMDGVVARTYHTGSIASCIFDGVADVSFYAVVLFYIKKHYSDLLRGYYPALAGVLAGQLFAWLVCIVKFSRISSWHSYMAKIFGIGIFFTVVSVVCFRTKRFLPLLIIIATLYLIDDVAITLVMPHWRVSVLSVFDALRYNI